MALKDSYDDYDALIIDFCLTALIFAPILLVPPAAVLLVIFLQGLLVALGITLGATVYGLVVVACIIAAGLLGLGLVLLINYTVNYFVNRSKDPKNQDVTEANMEGKEALQVIAITESSSLLDDAHDINENSDGIEQLKKFGQEIAIALYQKTLNKEDDIEKFLQDNINILTARYKKLALKYHPDKGGQEDQFKNLTDACEKIRKSWKLALYGVNPEQYPKDIDDPYLNQENLLKAHNALLEKCIALLEKLNEELDKRLDVIFSEENIARIESDLRKKIITGLENDGIYPAYTPSFWQSACQTVGSNMNAVYESASAACTKLYENLCTNKKEL